MTIDDYSYYSYYSLFATIRCSLFAIRDYSLFALRYSLFGFSRHPVHSFALLVIGPSVGRPICEVRLFIQSFFFGRRPVGRPICVVRLFVRLFTHSFFWSVGRSVLFVCSFTRSFVCLDFCS